MFIQTGIYQDRREMMTHRLHYLLNPADPNSKNAIHNVLPNYPCFGNFANPDEAFHRNRKNSNQNLGIFAGCHLVAATVFTAVDKRLAIFVLPVIFILGIILYKNCYCKSSEKGLIQEFKEINKKEAIESLVGKINIIGKYLSVEYKETCKELGNHNLQTLKTNLLKMSLYGDKISHIVESPEVSNSLTRILEKAKEFTSL
jgi:hypothetical protein